MVLIGVLVQQGHRHRSAFLCPSLRGKDDCSRSGDTSSAASGAASASASGIRLLAAAGLGDFAGEAGDLAGDGDFAGEAGDLAGDGDFAGIDDRFSGPAIVAVRVELLDSLQKQGAVAVRTLAGNPFAGLEDLLWAVSPIGRGERAGRTTSTWTE